jgi:hypothetical protein
VRRRRIQLFIKDTKSRKELQMNRALKNGIIASIVVFVVVCLGTVAAQDVIVKQGTIGTGNASPDSRAKVFISEAQAETYYQEYGLLTVTTDPVGGTENNIGMFCEFFPDASTYAMKVGGWFRNYPVGTQTFPVGDYYSLFGYTAGKPNAYSTNGKSVSLTGILAVVENANNVAGTYDDYCTTGLFAYATPVTYGHDMTGALSFRNSGLDVCAILGGDYQATSGSGQNFGAYIETYNFLEDYADATINSYALYLKPFTGNAKLHGGQTYGLYQEGSGVMNYFEGNISAADVTDRTLAYSGTSQDALAEILNVKSVNGEIDHGSLPGLARATVHRVVKTNRRAVERTDPVGHVIQKEQYDVSVVEEEGRSLGGMITVLTEAVKGLNEKVEALAAENQVLKAEIAALKATAATP